MFHESETRSNHDSVPLRNPQRTSESNNLYTLFTQLLKNSGISQPRLRGEHIHFTNSFGCEVLDPQGSGSEAENDHSSPVSVQTSQPCLVQG